MSKKNKRVKKGRKVTGIDSSSKSQGRDEVTGLSVELGGKVFRDNQVLDTPDSVGGIQRIEFELSDKTIAINALILDSAGEVTAAVRQIMEGDFKYDKNGLLTNMTLNQTADWTKSAPFNGSWERGNIRQGQLKLSGFISDGGDEWNSASKEVHSFAIDNGESAEDPKGNFFSYVSSRFYEDKWWDNLFATNLI